MRAICPTCGRPGSDGGVCSNGFHINEAYRELEEAVKLLRRVEARMSPGADVLHQIALYIQRREENEKAAWGTSETPRAEQRCDNCDMQGQGCILPQKDGIPTMTHCFLPDTYTGGNSMLHLPGTIVSFRCHCGGNVFSKHKTDPLKYRCNSCKTLYEGDK
jgi:hypothetical protein